ncbi:MAG: hypothetical protein AB1782_14935, partial [Cyanobacteriota bacterium]
MDKVKISYMGFSSPTSNTYMGGIMVCDEKGFPVEFRYSEPIKPTNVQSVLYGKSLEKYIKIDVISETLLKSISTSVEIMVVHDEYVLEHDFSSNYTIIKISPTKSPPLSDPGDNIKIKDREYLLQTIPNSHPLRIQFSSAMKLDEVKIKSALDVLGQAGQTMDIEEPLSRVYRALELICQ